LISANGSSIGTRNSPSENICMDSDGMLHVTWVGLGIGINVYYGNSSDNGETWETKKLVGNNVGNRDHAGIVCGQNGFLMIYYYNATQQEVLGLNSTDGGKTWTSRFEIEGDLSIEDDPSCAIDSADNVHCCMVDAFHKLYYTNSTIYGSTVTVNSNTNDDTDMCDIEVDSNDCVYIIGMGADGDDVDIWSPCDKGWGDGNRSEIYNGGIFTNAQNGPSLAIDNDDRIHIAVYESAGGSLRYCNGTTSNLTSWDCQLVDEGISRYPDIAVNKDGHIFILYADNVPSSGAEIYYSNSSDGSRGATWTVRTELNKTSGYPSIADSNWPKSNRMTDVLHWVFTHDNDNIYYDNFSIPFIGTPLENQSRIKNEQTDTDELTFLMKVQFFNSTTASWIDVNTTYEDYTLKTITGLDTLKLDQYWVPWNSSFGNKGTGTYRAYIEVYDDDNNTIANNEGNNFDAYNFSLS